MLVYILKSSTCLGILYLFYQLLLEHEKMHFYKRCYLIAILLISFFIPFVTVSTDVLASETIPKIVVVNTNEKAVIYTLFSEILPYLVWTIYWIGLVFFGGRFWKNLISIISEIRKNSKVEKQYYQYVLLYKKVIPHTFLKYIFLNKSDFECNSIPKEVLLHEQAHADQRHSIDIICIEILQVIFWFNPLIYLIKKSIKLNHEFLADEAVLSEGVETSQYQKMLLTFSTKTTTPIFTNSINYSIIKKRFTLMKAKKSKNKTWFKGLLVLPLVAILTFSFSTKETIKFQDETSLEIDVQEGATRAQIKEYNKLAKHYNATNPTSMFIKISDVKRLTYLYGLMTERQIKKVEAFPNFPPPPPAPNKEKETIFVKIGVNDKDPNSPPPPPKRTIK